MNTLNLIDSEVSTIKFKTIFFPDGQPHIKIDVTSCSVLNKKEPVVVITRISSANDLLMLLLVKNTLDSLGFEQVALKISYLMAARMDRIMLEGEPFSLEVVSQVLNQAGFYKVEIFDPHSPVSTNKINNAVAVNNHQFVQHAIEHYKKNKFDDSSTFTLVSPDAGALKKIYAVATATGGLPVVECKKVRDVKSGVLSGFTVFAEDLSGKTCFIIDDICDGGGTFIGIAAALKNLGAERIILVVSHGIFSKGFHLKHVDEIYCTNSFKTFEGTAGNVHVLPVLDYL